MNSNENTLHRYLFDVKMSHTHVVHRYDFYTIIKNIQKILNITNLLNSIYPGKYFVALFNNEKKTKITIIIIMFFYNYYWSH